MLSFVFDIVEVNIDDMDVNLPIDHAIVLSSSPGLCWIGGLGDLAIVVQPLFRHLSHQQGGPAD